MTSMTSIKRKTHMTADSGGDSSRDVVLRGLPGDNPLGFLAALGVQTALEAQGYSSKLHWTDEPSPHPVLSGPPTVVNRSHTAAQQLSPLHSFKEIADAVLMLVEKWLAGPVFDVEGNILDEPLDRKLKLKPPQIRQYLSKAREYGDHGVLAACLLAEDSLDNNGNAKPSDFYFTAGQQKFVDIVRELLCASQDEIIDDMTHPWSYKSKKDSLMWDTVDDRLHGYSALDPKTVKKLTNPGVEALAIIGLSRYPCFASPSQGTLTQGCSGAWKNGKFVWPVWVHPASVRSVNSLVAQVAAPPTADNGSSAQPGSATRSDSAAARDAASRQRWYRAWGVSRLMQSQIRRSDSGGYGTFGPPRTVWQRE